MITIPKSTILLKVPYVGPVLGAVGVATYINEIVTNTTTPIEVAKIITSRIVNRCTPPEIFIAGKCVMLAGEIIASVSPGGSPLVVSSTLAAFGSIIQTAK